MFLNEKKLFGLLCGRIGRYIVEDSGALTLKRPDGSDVELLEDGTLQRVHPKPVHVERLINKGRLVRDGSKYRLKDGATDAFNLDYSM
jgi:hypothetical protein